MPLLKKTIMWCFFLAAMYLGGMMTRSGSNFMQGMGFMSMVAALVCLYLVLKLIWGPLSRSFRLILIVGVVWYCAYSIGLFNGNTLQSFLSGKATPAREDIRAEKVDSPDVLSDEIFAEPDENRQSAEKKEQPRATSASGENTGLIGKIKALLFGTAATDTNTQVLSVNPMEYPEIKGYPKVLSGSILYLDDIKIKLFGIDAPDRNQICADRYNQNYNCGVDAMTWLHDWLEGKEVSCHILSKIEQGWATGSCFTDNHKYDVAAVVVNAGWAVAYTRSTDIYVPYEKQAADARRGLWSGTFYKPWDWRDLQNRKYKVKVNYSKKKLINTDSVKKFDFGGLF